MRSVMEALGLATAAKLATATADPTRANERIANRRARAMLDTAYAQRDKHAAAKPTGVRIKGSNGVVLDVYDDGSHRKLWTRKTGLSGRQFRKLRKVVNRKLRAEAKAKVA